MQKSQTHNSSIKPEDFDWSLTETIQTKVLMLNNESLYDSGTLATLFTKDAWKFCAANYCNDGANITFCTWQACISLDDAS